MAVHPKNLQVYCALIISLQNDMKRKPWKAAEKWTKQPKISRGNLVKGLHDKIVAK